MTALLIVCACIYVTGVVLIPGWILGNEVVKACKEAGVPLMSRQKVFLAALVWPLVGLVMVGAVARVLWRRRFP